MPTGSTIEDLVVRHHDSPSPRLTHDWALLRLLDERFCTTLAKDLGTDAGQWEVFENVTQRLHENLPDEPGLYMFVWRPPFAFDVDSKLRSGDLAQVLYVGMAGGASGSKNTIRERFKNYRKHVGSDPASLWEATVPKTRMSLLGRYLTLRPLEFWCSVVPDRANVAPLEKRLLKLLNPPCNGQLLPALVVEPREPAFGPTRLTDPPVIHTP